MTREEKRAQWAERIRAQESCGKSVFEFCREQGVGTETFRYWKGKLRGLSGEKQDANPQPSARFTRVELVRPVAPRAVAVSVRLPGGVIVEAPGGYPDPSWIRAIVSALTEAGFR